MSSVKQNTCQDCKPHESELKKVKDQTLKVKKENDDLRNQLKQISKTLDETLEEKARVKQINKPKQTQEQIIERLDKQLENAKKQVESYKKSLNFIKKQQSGDFSIQKVNELQLELREKQEYVKELKLQSKKLEAEKRQTENKLLRDKPDKQLNVLRDEIMQLKNRIRTQEKQKEQNKKNYEAQEKHIQELKDRQQKICQELNIENKIVQRPNQVSAASNEYEYIDSEDDDKKKKIKINFETFNKLENHQNILKEKLKSENKAHKRQVKLLEQKLQQVEKEKIELSSQKQEISEKLAKSTDKFKQVQQNMKRQSYTDMGILIKKEKGIRRVQDGNTVSSSSARSFRDSQDIALPEDMQIQEISITSYKNYILGIQVVYKNKKGEEKQKVDCFSMMEEIDGAQIQTIKLTSMEYITQLTGYYNTHIEYIKIITSRHQYICGGSDKEISRGGKRFILDIKKDERPSSFFGTVDHPLVTDRQKQIDPQEADIEKQYVLTAVGLELRKKDDLIKNDKNQILQMQSYSNKLKSSQLQSQQNESKQKTKTIQDDLQSEKSFNQQSNNGDSRQNGQSKQEEDDEEEEEEEEEEQEEEDEEDENNENSQSKKSNAKDQDENKSKEEEGEDEEEGEEEEEEEEEEDEEEGDEEEEEDDNDDDKKSQDSNNDKIVK